MKDEQTLYSSLPLPLPFDFDLEAGTYSSSSEDRSVRSDSQSESMANGGDWGLRGIETRRRAGGGNEEVVVLSQREIANKWAEIVQEMCRVAG